MSLPVPKQVSMCSSLGLEGPQSEEKKDKPTSTLGL